MPLSLSPSLLMSSASSVAFSPLSLFASGEQGAWYDPSDLTTMFQDTAGTTPVTATGQTVGLLLDKSQGLVLGPELVTNGDFSSATGWTLGAGWTISGGTANSDGTSFSNLSQAISIVAGRFYQVSLTVTGASPSLVIRLGTGGGAIALSIAAAGVYRFLAAAGSVDNVLIVRTGSSSSTLTVDNISVKELPGNHATQATAASRPIYGIEPAGGRRNLLVRTEEFDNAYWLKQRGSISGSYSGSSFTLQGFVEDGTTNSHRVVVNGVTVAASTTHTFSCYAKANTRSAVYISIQSGTANEYAAVVANLSNGTISATSVGTTLGTIVSSSITSVGDGVYRISFAYTLGSVTLIYPVIGISNSPTPSFSTNGDVSYAGNSTGSVFIGAAQLETGSTATAYQRVTDQWNVTQAGVPSVSYIQCDGTDDFLLTGTITPGIDKAQVFAGVRKLSDAATGVVLETSSNAGANNGVIDVQAPSGAAANYRFGSRGTIGQAGTASGFAAPITNVLTGIGDIAGDVATLRINGAQVATSAADQGTGNYLAYPLYIGRRGGTGLPYNGRIYQMLVRFGANLTAGQITQTETFVNSRTGAY